MPLFTASTVLRKVGDVVPVRDKPSRGHLARIADNEPWKKMEELLELSRRPDEQSRVTAYYACETPEECAAFIVPQLKGMFAKVEDKKLEIYYYTIDVSKATKTVMALIFRGMHHLDKPDVVQEICEEYWRQPKYKWKFFEHLVPEYRVVDVIAPPDEFTMYCATDGHTDDGIQAKRIWPET